MAERPHQPSAGRLRIRTLLVWLVWLSVLPLLLVEFITGMRLQQQQIDAARERVAMAAQVIAESNTRLVEGIGQLLVVLSISPEHLLTDAQACHDFFSGLLAREPSFRQMGFIGPRGQLICNGTEAGASIDVGDRDYFQAALKTDAMVSSGYLVGRLTGRRSMVFARRIVAADGTIKGVVFVSRDLDSLIALPPDRTTSLPVQTLLLDRYGVVLRSSHPQLHPASLPVADPVWQRAVQAHQGNAPLPPQAGNAEPMIRAFHPVRVRDSDQYYVAVAVNTEALTALARQATLLRLASMVGIALLIATLVWLAGSRMVVRPVERLVQELRRLGTGDFGPPAPVPPTPLKEVGELQQSLDRLSRDLARLHRANQQAQQSLVEREARFRELFENNPQVMYLSEAETLRFLGVNRAACEFYGYSAAEFSRMTLLDIRPPSEHMRLRHHISGHHPARRQGVPRIWTHRRKNGETRQMEVIYYTTTLDGQMVDFAMAVDVTDRLAAEAATRELNQTLEQRVAERTRDLRLSNQELESFAYSVSHELRNPLDAVAMFGQMLGEHLGDALDGQGRQYLSRIELGVRGMQRLTDDLLALARVTRMPLTITSVDLSALCGEVVHSLREREPQRTVAVSIEPGLRCQGDLNLLRLLMENLIGNAWKYTARTENARIDFGVEAPAGGGDPVYVVADNGAGFDMRFADRLFLPFERLHGDQDFPGTGIGLATARRIVARHGGSIWAQAEVGHGATLRFTLATPVA